MSDTSVIQSLVGSMDIGEIGDIIQYFLYQGFSPEMVLKHLAQIKEKGNISNSEFLREIKTMIVIGIIMGNYNDNNSNKISDEGKAKGDALLTKYQMKRGSVGKDKKAITIPRVLATFPIQTTKILSKAGAKNYNDAFGCIVLPTFMKSGVFPSVIPMSLPAVSKKVLLTASACYTAEQSMAISNISDAKEAFNAQKNYTEVSHNSSVPTASERATFFATLIFDYDALSQVIKNFSKIIGQPVAMPSKEDMTSAGVHF